nr:hypothetical protein [uncultured Methanoregula sp.]
MLLQEATPEMVQAWKETSDKYRPLLSPNKKTGPEIIAYLQQQYPVTEPAGDTIKRVVLANLLQNDYSAGKLPAGKTPVARGFCIGDCGAGNDLYENQDAIFKGKPIIVGVELESAFFIVEGSSRLWDELFAFRGLDDEDLTNFYLVAEYISCLERFGMLDRVLAL